MNGPRPVRTRCHRPWHTIANRDIRKCSPALLKRTWPPVGLRVGMKILTFRNSASSTRCYGHIDIDRHRDSLAQRNVTTRLYGHDRDRYRKWQICLVTVGIACASPNNHLSSINTVWTQQKNNLSSHKRNTRNRNVHITIVYKEPKEMQKKFKKKNWKENKYRLKNFLSQPERLS